MRADFAIQFIQRVENPFQDVVTSGREAVDARRGGALWLSRAKPATLRHSGQHGIQRAGTESIAVVVEFLEHPVTVDALLGGVVEDMDLPEGEKELADDWIAHDGA